MLLKGATKETITRIVGDGAVFPDSPQTRSDFLNEIFLTIQAASSGRPNKAMDIANFRDLAPLLAQSGANPIALVEEGVRRLDDNLDIDRFFPLSAPQAAEATSGSEQQSANSASESSETSPQNSLNDQNPESNSSMQSPPGAALAV
jgi:hypothetical protein